MGLASRNLQSALASIITSVFMLTSVPALAQICAASGPAEPAPADLFLVRGNTTNYGNLPNDGWVDFSLLTPYFHRSEIFQFNPNQIVSPLKDTMSVAGRSVKLPSNVSIPRQTESYIIPVRLEKPDFRLIWPELNMKRLYATRGRFKFHEVVDDLQSGKTFVDVIQHFDMVGGGRVDNFSVTQTVSVDVNMWQFDRLWELPFVFIPSGLQWSTIALFNDGDGLTFSDIKVLNQGNPATLKTPSHFAPRQLLHAVRALSSQNLPGESAYWQMSLAVQNEGEAVPNPLSLIDPPKFTNGKVQALPPGLRAGLKARGSAVKVWLMRDHQFDNQTFTITVPWWEKFTDSWVTSWSIPANVFQNLPPNSKLRIEVNYFASPEEKSKLTCNSVQVILSETTHATKHSVVPY